MPSGIKKPWTLSGPRLVAFVSGGLAGRSSARGGHTSPVRGTAERRPEAYRSCADHGRHVLRCVSWLGGGRRAERRMATPEPRQSTGRPDPVSRLSRG